MRPIAAKSPNLLTYIYNRTLNKTEAVSYTHLDVYKRQSQNFSLSLAQGYTFFPLPLVAVCGILEIPTLAILLHDDMSLSLIHICSWTGIAFIDIKNLTEDNISMVNGAPWIAVSYTHLDVYKRQPSTSRIFFTISMPSMIGMSISDTMTSG